MKALTNAKILCPKQGLIEGGTILFDEEKIHDVGKSVSIPEGTEVIDVQGKHVLPGFIDAHCHHGLFEGG
ncbi:MAG: amidohydrolase, partial [Candidatus Hodarchaeota archaeon]